MLTIFIHLYGLGQQLMNLGTSSPILSELISNSLKFGVPITIVIAGYLTVCRVKYTSISSGK